MSLPEEENRFLDTVLEKASRLDSPILFILHQLQERYGMIKPEHADHVSARLGIPLVRLHAAAEFYEHFTLERRGRYIIRLCRGIVCHGKGSLPILEALKERLGIEDGETTEDGMVTLETASCIGQCDGAPAMMINDVVYRDLTVEGAIAIIDDILKEGGA
ncbi:MAG: NAD(P)H-dependent oxidoreductase subunit E [Thermoplasmata archaeon]|nr:MAG: NAD(P)H-dependent oxidoreductase subunit E [Thermoplasmatales archaeon ex4484_6]RLF54935.1 MAG: NAD(P)H-dependent oxidoreductase subunit E [Thermoplasmata archaeon]RLF68866.1 MAG: NAD(P)H-dependent oxidoreductase subunit E [Thermoplasmata archaeon]